MSGLGRLRDWVVAALLYLGTRLVPRRRERRRPGQDIAPTLERELPGNRGAENVAILLLLATTVAAAAFIVVFVVVPDTQLLGLCLGLAFVFLGVAVAVLGKQVVPQEKAVEERKDFGDDEQDQEAEDLVKEAGESVSRRGLIVGAAGVAGCTLGAAALVPVSSLGPRVGAKIRATPWRAGRRVVDERGRPLVVDEIGVGTFRVAFPEGASRSSFGAPINVVRLADDEIALPDERRRGVVEGAIAYSRICPHAGCAVSMFRHPKFEPTEAQPALVCPCHFSTFDAGRGGAVLFGPSGRDLPQLPLMLNAERELVAAGDFFDRIGPSWSGVRKGGDSPGEGFGSEG